jgi:cytochrome c peroxidase
MSFRKAAVLGRRLYYNATDDVMSERLACAGCHPEGREDGQVWLEVPWDPERADELVYRVHETRSEIAPRLRQTPMLAGRVDAKGPYGWRAESETLAARLRVGFDLHRWVAHRQDPKEAEARAMFVAAFVSKGLVPPLRAKKALSASEERGRALFTSDTVGCAGCHVPATGYSDRVAIQLRVPHGPRRAVDESHVPFKTPDLRYVAGTPPYFHNGSVVALEDLVHENADRMGKTSHLSRADQDALIAFLKTL